MTPVDTPFCLILDDYHAIDSREIDTALATLLELMPPQMTLLITSRSDPGFPISRLRARGQMIELRATDLRFTDAEAAQFLQETMGLTLTTEQIAALESQTEGWIAGLQMAAISMQNRDHSDLAGFVQSFTGSHRFIMDYLTDEVLAQVSPDVQSFLLLTAVLNRLNAGLCDALLSKTQALTSNRQSQQILEQLEVTNTFLMPLDDERCWYRYHHLFADLLRQKVSADTASTIRQQAALWSAENDLMEDAIDYAIAAGALDMAVPWLVENGLRFLFQGKLSRLRRWYDAFPHERLLDQPRLCLDYAWVLMNQGERDAVEPYLLAVEAATQGAPDTRVVTALIRANNARNIENLPVMQAEATLALKLAPADGAEARCSALLQLGVVQLMAVDGDWDVAVQLLEESAALAQQGSNLNMAFVAGGYLGLAYLQRGEVATATAVLNKTYTLATEQGQGQSPVLTYLHLGLAHLAFLAGDWEEARREITQVEAHGRFHNAASGVIRSSMLLALVAQKAGDAETVRLAVESVEEAAVSIKNPDLAQQVEFLKSVFSRSDPPPMQLQTVRRLAAGASLARAKFVAAPEIAQPEQPLVDPLSERELEVLTLIATGLKNKEVAEELFISLNTVLHHTKNIYSKLGVNKRALAIAKGRELNLIQ
ncbi:MAG: LuxR C-terminal-related transcriptional regulator [Chloroflexota bacterium]